MEQRYLLVGARQKVPYRQGSLLLAATARSCQGMEITDYTKHLVIRIQYSVPVISIAETEIGNIVTKLPLVTKPMHFPPSATPVMHLNNMGIVIESEAAKRTSNTTNPMPNHTSLSPFAYCRELSLSPPCSAPLASSLLPCFVMTST